MATVSAFRVEKRRVEATVTLSSGESAHGSFFVASASARHEGPERVGDLLNEDTGFFPFERLDGGVSRMVLYNRKHLVLVMLAEPEASHDPGYDFAKRHSVSLLLTSGQRIFGAVRIARPEGRDRVSDWARSGDAFLYVEADEATFLVNAEHIVELSEVEES